MSGQPIDIWRILDTAANRAGEGLRVVEEYARFALNDGHLTQILKELRHELTAAICLIPESSRLSARDTVGDVGTTIETASEYSRCGPLDVVRASLKRTQEALRTLEEYGKLTESSGLASEFAHRIEQLRYRHYTLEKALLHTVAAIERLHDARLYLLVTSENCACGLETTVRSAISAGVKIVQLREKTLHDRELVQLARRVRTWSAEEGALLIINDRADVAVLSDADGVHVGQDELSVQDARRIVGPDRLIGVSTHSLDQARQAVMDGADYLGVGPTFPSGTKPFNGFTGLELIQSVAAQITLPWFAIGGLNSTNIRSVQDSGAGRFAVSGSICRAIDPRRATAELMDQIE